MSENGLPGLLRGTHTFMVGLEDNGDGALRVYLKHRPDGLYALVYDDDAKQLLRESWGEPGTLGHGGHLTVPIPPQGCVFRARERGEQ